MSDNCTGVLEAAGPGPSQSIALPPFEVTLSLSSGIWTLTATVTCNGQTGTAQTTTEVVAPNPVTVSIRVVLPGAPPSEPEPTPSPPPPPPPGSFGLTVTKAGSGSGTVSSSPSGIICGTDCSEPYTAGTVVTLTATAASGSSFGGWSGGGCSGTGTCTVTMSMNQSVTATFNLLGTLQVTNSASGYSCCDIPLITFSGPGPIAPISGLVQGETNVRSNVVPGSYTASWCAGPTPFSISAGITTTLVLDGGNCG